MRVYSLKLHKDRWATNVSQLLDLYSVLRVAVLEEGAALAEIGDSEYLYDPLDEEESVSELSRVSVDSVLLVSNSSPEMKIDNRRFRNSFEVDLFICFGYFQRTDYFEHS